VIELPFSTSDCAGFGPVCEIEPGQDVAHVCLSPLWIAGDCMSKACNLQHRSIVCPGNRLEDLQKDSTSTL
jgi:hypothetical protein